MSALVPYAAWLVPRVVLGVGLAMLMTRGLDRAPAHVRHATLASGLAGALLLPAMWLLPPLLRLPVLPPPRALAVVPSGGVLTPVPGPVDWVALLLTGVWSVGMVLVLGRRLMALARLRSLARDTRAAAPRVQERFRHCCRLLHLDPARVRVRQSDGIPGPLSWGVRQPVVAVPVAAAQWPRARLDEALMHELSHVRRRDWLMQRIADLTCAVYWFLPPVWLATRGLHLEAERACDDAVVLAFGGREDYAAHLLSLAQHERESGGIWLAASMVERRRQSQLARRIHAILDPLQRRNAMRRSSIWLVYSFLVVAFVGLAGVRAVAATATPLPAVPPRAVEAPAAPVPPAPGGAVVTPRAEAPGAPAAPVAGDVPAPAGPPAARPAAEAPAPEAPALPPAAEERRRAEQAAAGGAAQRAALRRELAEVRASQAETAARLAGEQRRLLRLEQRLAEAERAQDMARRAEQQVTERSERVQAARAETARALAVERERLAETQQRVVEQRRDLEARWERPRAERRAEALRSSEESPE